MSSVSVCLFPCFPKKLWSIINRIFDINCFFVLFCFFPILSSVLGSIVCLSWLQLPTHTLSSPVLWLVVMQSVSKRNSVCLGLEAELGTQTSRWSFWGTGEVRWLCSLEDKLRLLFSRLYPPGISLNTSFFPLKISSRILTNESHLYYH